MRIVHNITFHVDKAIEKEWVEAITRDYLHPTRSPAALFTRVKLAGEGEEEPTFSLQRFFDREEEHRRFVEEELEEGLHALSRRFPGGFLYFCTTLEEVIHET
jgi:hypothetical protein